MQSKIHGNGNFRNQKGRKFLIVLRQETMTLINKFYIPCSIFESTMVAIYGISRIPSAAKALPRSISKYT